MLKTSNIVPVANPQALAAAGTLLFPRKRRSQACFVVNLIMPGCSESLFCVGFRVDRSIHPGRLPNSFDFSVYADHCFYCFPVNPECKPIVVDPDEPLDLLKKAVIPEDANNIDNKSP